MTAFTDYASYLTRMSKPNHRWQVIDDLLHDTTLISSQYEASPGWTGQGTSSEDTIGFRTYGNASPSGNPRNALGDPTDQPNYASPGNLTKLEQFDDVNFIDIDTPSIAPITQDYWLGRSTFSPFHNNAITEFDAPWKGCIMLFDLLAISSDGSGYNLFTTGDPITTNLPTAPLTRYTDGEGVWPVAFFGNKGTSITWRVRYKNGAGTLRTSTMPVNCRKISNVGYQSGDTSCKSIDEYGNDTSQSGTGFQLALIKPLLIQPCVQGHISVYEPAEAGRFVQIKSGASLQAAYLGTEVGRLGPLGDTYMNMGLMAIELSLVEL